ncbi:MAG TPA: ABC transporter ATP-binding protein [bacterium]|uniref:Lipoprotein-releasing system ATP-binding protein LolD n=1 Tax=candidate division TA06 bacterium ADurb.Bin417 TaxID=1852828 RepID=A0A1V5MJ41_UNCT6|nr:MAG: Lipoprotein-releasing system ATP-binding protein LolD [candidate division TA06 bacterium ADurb.Bin417]HNQ34556.1 ABC transporter ATP-binding protein [bacterium]HNS49240.1 ABC transporter ATP-binding protein [bacterium]
MELTGIGLQKIFGDGQSRVRALDGVDISLRPGEITLLLGPSGSGKTTLLNLLSGLDEPTGGQVRFDGRPLSGLSDREKSLLRNRHFGFVFQFFNLLPEFTLLENVMLAGLIGGRSRNSAEARLRAVNLMERLGLADRLDARPSELSGGEQQRVAIGRALVNRPDFVFADEPTGNLDRQNAENCLQLFRDLNREHGTAFIIATHNPEIAALLSSRVISLKNGKIT